MSVLVLALNPCVDAEWIVDRVMWEEKNVIRAERRWAGGKGVNVARWLGFFNADPMLLLPLGGQPGGEMKGYLIEEGLNTKIAPLQEATRVNVIVTTVGQGQLRFNQTGPKISISEWGNLLRHFKRLLPRADCLVISGSQPRGVAVEAYGHLIRLAAKARVRTVLDCDGGSFKSALGAKPFLVKPNEHELEQWAGKTLKTEGSLLRAAKAVSEITGGWVFVSRGSDGGMLVNCEAGISLAAAAPKVVPRTTVGAGDALVAAVARQIVAGTEPAEWLRRGLAAGAAATQCEAGNPPRAGLVEGFFRRIVPKPLA